MNVIYNTTEHIYQYASFGDDYLSLASLSVGSTRYLFASLPLVLIFTRRKAITDVETASSR